ncbi:Cyclin-L2 [Hypsibius exemplaris]|uniref:Cyclin-L2 n=1 Tax=Hypsibius exemplaris TaxID=2072580 RepID=A0A1W0WCR9_HYPEX|nr:Cyclin-L2 [Hypsibius exemplaris]
MLEVESRGHLSKKSSNLMEVFEKRDRKSSDHHHRAPTADIVVKKRVPTAIVKAPPIKAETTTAAENGEGEKNNTETSLKTSSMSPDLLTQQRANPPPPQTSLQRTFGRVVISLENLILPDERLHPTPSMVEGLDGRTEWFLRRLGCDLIQHAGILLKLPQTAMATAQVLYQRFYHIKSFLRHDYFTIAIACIYLASKVEEFPKRLRDIINVFTHVRQTLCNEPIEPMILDYGYVNLKNQVIKCERRLLKELGFCVHVKHPHKLICMYLQVLELDRNNTFVQRAWNYMNDSLRTDLFVRFSPEAVACGCIFLTARKLQVPLPQNISWSSLFGVTKENMEEIATSILLLYSIKLPPVLEIEGKITAMRKAMDTARSKGPLGIVIDQETGGTPDSVHTTPEQAAAKETEPRPSKDEPSSKEREKRHRSSSADRLAVREEKRRRAAASPRNGSRYRSSRSRSADRQRSREDGIRARSNDRKRSPSRGSRPAQRSPHGSSPLIGGGKRDVQRNRDRDDRRRSRSRDDRDYRRRSSRSRSPVRLSSSRHRDGGGRR